MIRGTRNLVILLVKVYQATLGSLLGGNCRFHPSCSNYAIEAISANGVMAGGLQAIWRVVRCGPWSKGGVDRPRPLTASARAQGAARG